MGNGIGSDMEEEDFSHACSFVWGREDQRSTYDWPLVKGSLVIFEKVSKTIKEHDPKFTTRLTSPYKYSCWNAFVLF